MSKEVTPKFLGAGFNCPHCEAYTQQRWYVMNRGRYPTNDYPAIVDNFYIAICQKHGCGEISIWKSPPPDHEYTTMLYPDTRTAPLPSEDMPEEIMQVYDEAREIFNYSPRASAALLRLAIQLLMPHLEEKGKNLNNDIGNLVKKGLSKNIQKALDGVRVIGNNSVHPGQIDINDNQDIALALFSILNIIIDKMITEPNVIEEVYNMIPDTQKQQIEERDNSDQNNSSE